MLKALLGEARATGEEEKRQSIDDADETMSVEVRGLTVILCYTNDTSAAARS